jgi:FdhD protein
MIQLPSPSVVMPHCQPETLPGYHYVATADGDAHALANEVPLAILLNGVSHAVMMVSPCQLDEFITGFLVSEGIIRHPREIHDLEFHRQGDALEADALEARVTLGNGAHYRWKEHKRSLAGRTGCGLCGIESLAQALPGLPRLPTTPLPPVTALEKLYRQLPDWQPLGQECGSLHAAFFADLDGQILHACEDVGRHNALDKLIGTLLHQKRPASPGMVLMTSRCSIELVQKMGRAGLPTLVTLGAPTGLAVRQAREAGLNLLHLPRNQSPRVYSTSITAHDQETRHHHED